MKSMFEMVKAFPAQLTEAMEIAENAMISRHDADIQNIIVSGMGGSGIGADFVASLIRHECRLPFVVSKTYDLPEFAGVHSLAIFSSYSGNTEETLSALHHIKGRGCKCVAISSGGQLIEFAKNHGMDHIQVPSGWPSPRACLGYSIVSQLYVLHKLGIISNGFIAQLKSIAADLQKDTPEIIQRAKHLASLLESKMVAIYSGDRLEPVSVRFRQQINENSKMLCWHHVLPEMNHNELVGWRWKQPALAVVVLRSEEDHPRIQARIELTKEVVSHYTNTVIDLYAKGGSLLERSLYLVHVLDYTSVFLADFNKVDATEVRVIDFLKSELSKL